jgi:hypothetical protein
MCTWPCTHVHTGIHTCAHGHTHTCAHGHAHTCAHGQSDAREAPSTSPYLCWSEPSSTRSAGWKPSHARPPSSPPVPPPPAPRTCSRPAHAASQDEPLSNHTSSVSMPFRYLGIHRDTQGRVGTHRAGWGHTGQGGDTQGRVGTHRAGWGRAGVEAGRGGGRGRLSATQRVASCGRASQGHKTRTALLYRQYTTVVWRACVRSGG